MATKRTAFRLNDRALAMIAKIREVEGFTSDADVVREAIREMYDRCLKAPSQLAKREAAK